jgi:hypothetical protein
MPLSHTSVINAFMKRPILHVLAPGLLNHARHWARDNGSFPRFAGIEAIMAKGHQQIVAQHGIDTMLCWLFGPSASADRDLPLGAIRRYGYKRDRDQDCWICADLIHLSADASKVFMRDSASLKIA